MTYDVFVFNPVAMHNCCVGGSRNVLLPPELSTIELRSVFLFKVSSCPALITAYFVALCLCLPVVLLTVFIKLPIPAISATVLTKPGTFATSSSPSYQLSGVANFALF